MIFKPKHVARNIIVALDFDGTVAKGDPARIAATKAISGLDVTAKQITKKTTPLSRDKYEEMTTLAGTTEYMKKYYELLPHVKNVLSALFHKGFRFVIVTSRPTEILHGVKAYLKQEGLPIKYYHNTAENEELGITHKTKSYLCKRLCARIMLEDSLHKLQEMSHTFVRLYYLRTKANAHEDVPHHDKDKIFEVNNWNEFYNQCIYLKEMHEAICHYNGWENYHGTAEKIANFWKQYPVLCDRILQDYNKRAA